MDHVQYLGLLFGCLLATVPLEFAYHSRVWRAPGRLFAALLPGVLIFTLWDLIAIYRGHWHFSGRFTTGWNLGGHLPVEEILFFVVVPAAAISGFEAVRASLARRSGAEKRA